MKIVFRENFYKKMSELILDPIIPYVGPISGGRFTSEKLVELQATVPLNAYGFDINFQCGPNTFPHDDIALQISVRLLNGYVGLNSMEDGIWGKEACFSNVFIEANQKFEIIVLCEFNQYKIIINNEHECVFPKRIGCKKITHLCIDGDVSIIQISYKSIKTYLGILRWKIIGVVVLQYMLIIFTIAVLFGLVYWKSH